MFFAFILPFQPKTTFINVPSNYITKVKKHFDYSLKKYTMYFFLFLWMGILKAHLPKYLGLFNEKKNSQPPSTIKRSMLSKHRHVGPIVGPTLWGVFPQAIACNVGILFTSVSSVGG